jgi:hypothetical protein
MGPNISYTSTSLSELLDLSLDVAWSRIFGEQVILGFSQKLELYQLLDLDAVGEAVDGEECSNG